MHDQREYWNGPGSDKTFSTPVRTELLVSRLPSSARILDVGCGYGRALAELKRDGFSRLVGVDTAPGMIARGRKEHPDLDLRAVEPGPLPLEDGSFDAALLLAVLTCLPVDADQEALAAELFRVLTPGGLLLVNDFLLNDDRQSFERYRSFAGHFGTWGIFQTPDGAVVRHYDPARLKGLFADWTTLHQEEQIFTTMLGNRRRGLTLLLKRP